MYTMGTFDLILPHTGNQSVALHASQLVLTTSYLTKDQRLGLCYHEDVTSTVSEDAHPSIVLFWVIIRAAT